MFKAEDSGARNFMYSALFWLVFAITIGPVMATQFIAPDFLKGIPWLEFARIRQVHTNGLLFGWISMSMIGGWLYIIPRLVGRRLYSERLANLTMLLWNFIIAAGAVTLALGFTQAREYAELVWPLDILVLVALVSILYNVLRTVLNRTEEKLYVSTWYVMGTLIWFPIVYAIGNVVWNPPSGALTGLNDAIWGWFYGHNVLGLWFTTGVLALIYYTVPRITKTPLYGHTLSLIAFWTLAFFYTAVGTHHILQSPVPEWLKTIAVVSSVGLLIPVFSFLTNIFLTMRGNWKYLARSIPLRFAFFSAIWYLLVCIQGPFQALRSVNAFIHFGNWSVAHAHLALTAFASFGTMGIVYYALPRILKRELYSYKLAWAHWWLTFVGFSGFFTVLTFAGLVQSSAWSRGIALISILPSLFPYFVSRAVFGIMIVIGQYIFFYNLVRTAGAPVASYDPVYEKGERAPSAGLAEEGGVV